MGNVDRIPEVDVRTRRALAGTGAVYIPYSGAEFDLDLGGKDLTTTGDIAGGTMVVDGRDLLRYAFMIGGC